MCAEFYGAGADAFFNYEDISKDRVLEYPMLPSYLSGKLPQTTKLRIPMKAPGEKRILSADIALMATTKGASPNDATAIFINKLTPSRGFRYVSNIVYTENNEGYHTEDQAVRLRKLFDEFECDYLVLDTRNVGLSIYDLLSREITDPDTGEVYPPLSCCNNKELAARCNTPDAKKVIWSVQGSTRFNADAAVLLREGLKSGRIRLLIPEHEAKELLNGLKGYKNLSPADQVALTLPYINTTLLINELVNLKHEGSGQAIRLVERGNARKDRYSSLSYNYYVAVQLERDLRKSVSNDDEKVSDVFMYRKPKSFAKKGR